MIERGNFSSKTNENTFKIAELHKNNFKPL